MNRPFTPDDDGRRFRLVTLRPKSPLGHDHVPAFNSGTLEFPLMDPGPLRGADRTRAGILWGGRTYVYVLPRDVEEVS